MPTDLAAKLKPSSVVKHFDSAPVDGLSAADPTACGAGRL